MPEPPLWFFRAEMAVGYRWYTQLPAMTASPPAELEHEESRVHNKRYALNRMLKIHHNSALACNGVPCATALVVSLASLATENP